VASIEEPTAICAFVAHFAKHGALGESALSAGSACIAR